MLYNMILDSYIDCGERTGVLGGGGAVVAHGSSALVPLIQLTYAYTPISLPHVLF